MSLEQMRGPAARAARAAMTEAIETLGIVAVIRLRDAQKLRAIVDALIAGGVRALEVTMTVPDAVRLIGELSASLPPEFWLGAGTVLDAGTATAVIDAGARFVVSPVLRREIITVCHEHAVPAFPAGFSPTEILDAHDAGADIVKVFPATVLGPQFIKDLRGPLPQVKLMPTGGVTPENVGEWIRAGAAAVGIGSAILDPAAIAQGHWSVIVEKTRVAVAAVNDARARA
jgi:2-dehydro-3-deoxyphosphogluconate aldolase / (4S)-4-hydroxy-2-oxoglutarate aldolase